MCNRLITSAISIINDKTGGCPDYCAVAGGKNCANKDGTVWRRNWLKAIKLTHKHTLMQCEAKMFVSQVLEGKLQVSLWLVSQCCCLLSTLTERTENKTSLGLTFTFIAVKLNNPKSPFCVCLCFEHQQIEFQACCLVTIIFSVIVSSISVLSLLTSKLFLVLAAIRELMTTANLALSCFMVIALKQPSHFRAKTVNGLLYCFLFPWCC